LVKQKSLKKFLKKAGKIVKNKIVKQVGKKGWKQVGNSVVVVKQVGKQNCKINVGEVF